MSLRQGNGLTTKENAPTLGFNAFFGLKDRDLRLRNCPEPPNRPFPDIWDPNEEKRFF